MLQPVFHDALKMDLVLSLQEIQYYDHVSIVGNLPFGVASVLLQNLLRMFDTSSVSHELVLMFQKEVGDRIVAQPGSKDYGRLAITAQNAYSTDIPLIVPAKEFVPKPKVDAAVVRFQQPRSQKTPYSALSAVTAKAFMRRNRMIGSIFRDVGIDIGSGILDPTTRPARMSVAQYQSLCNHLLASHPTFFSR